MQESLVKNLTEIGLYRVPYNLQVLRDKLNDPYLNLYALYESECEKMVLTSLFY